MKKAVYVVVVLVVVAFVVWAALGRGGPTGPKYKLAKAEYGAVAEIVSEAGSLTPLAATEVAPSIAGRADEVYVKNGDAVAVGDDLFRIVNDKTGQERTVTAPVEGQVANLALTEGSEVSVGTSDTGQSAATSAAPALVIADLSVYRIKMAVSEVDVAKLKEGQTATVTFDALPDKSFAGDVERVDTLGTNTQGVVTYNVYLGLKGPFNGLRPAMTANVDVEVDKQDKALLVPSAAVKPYKGGKAVRVLAGGGRKIRYVVVELGIEGAERTEIVKGLNLGDKVVTGVLATAGSSGGLLRPPGGP